MPNQDWKPLRPTKGSEQDAETQEDQGANPVPVADSKADGGEELLGQPLFEEDFNNQLEDQMNTLEDELPKHPLPHPEEPQIPSPLGERAHPPPTPAKSPAADVKPVATPCRAVPNAVSSKDRAWSIHIYLRVP